MAGFIKIAKEEIIKKMGEKKANSVKIVPISTPSFVDSHFKGYDNAIKALVDNLAEDPTESNDKVNIIPGMVNPGDTREIKHILTMMGVEGIILNRYFRSF